MKNRIVRSVLLAGAWPLLCLAQSAAPAPVTSYMVVTIGHHYGVDSPALTKEDLTIVTPTYEPLAVTNLVPLRGDRAALELYIVVDNCSSCEPGTKFQELSRFIGSQAATTAVGVAYLTNGKLTVAETPTFDHALAVKALSPPTGSKPASPYEGLKALIGNWHGTSSRRAVVMITNGINPAPSAKAMDPLAEAAIEAAQRAGVTVYAIYHPSADYIRGDASAIYDGQVQMAHVTHDTGGEAYFMGFGPLPSIAPFLADISDHLSNQYLLEFLANPTGKNGALQELTVKARNADLELMVPERAWVPAKAPEAGR